MKSKFSLGVGAKEMYKYFLWPCQILTVFLMLAPVPGKAVDVTVGGFVYNIVDTGLGLSFNSQTPLLTDPTSAPWWNNDQLANDFALAYFEQVNPDNNLKFASGVTGASSSDRVNGFASSFSGTQFVVEPFRAPPTSTTIGSWAYTIGAPVSVPEINGSSFLKLFLVFGTLCLTISAVRRQGVRKELG